MRKSGSKRVQAERVPTPGEELFNVIFGRFPLKEGKVRLRGKISLDESEVLAYMSALCKIYGLKDELLIGELGIVAFNEMRREEGDNSA